MAEQVCILSIVWAKWYFDNHCDKAYYGGVRGNHYAEAILNLAKVTLATDKKYVITPYLALEPSFEPVVISTESGDVDGFKMTLEMLGPFSRHDSKELICNIVLEPDRAIFKTASSLICVSTEGLDEPLTEIYRRFSEYYPKDAIIRTMTIDSRFPEWGDMEDRRDGERGIDIEQASTWLGQAKGDSQKHT